MTFIHTTWAGLRHIGQAISQGNDLSPKSGVWVTRISRQAILGQYALYLAVLLFNVTLWWLGGRTPKLWMGLVMTVAVLPLALISAGVAHVLDKDPDRPPTTRTFLLWAGLTAGICIPLGKLILHVGALITPFPPAPLWLGFVPELGAAFIIGFSYWRLMIVSLWHERLATEELKRHNAEQALALAETRLHMLQAQIEPHFLFNTLASVQHLVRKDPDQADVLLTQLTRYLRQAIPDARASAATLGRECASIQTYLDIVRIRMGGRLTVTVDCAAALEDVAVPALIIHTLVENAIKHGVEMKTGPVSIAVTARATVIDGVAAIAITVQDNGVGPGATPTVSGGVGLRNIRDRLALAYGGQARLAISDAPGGGVCATVTLPRSKQ